MLQPKRTKYRKFQKGRVKGVCPNTTSIEFGQFAIKALQAGRIPAKTVEAVRRILTRKFKRTGQIWIRVFPDVSVSAKPAEVRMGKGKGSPLFWVCRVQKGQIIFEIDGVSFQLAKQAALLAYYKLPIKTKFCTRDPVYTKK